MTFNFHKAYPYSIGFEEMWKQLDNFNDAVKKVPAVSWPPYNIKKVSENKYCIELAVVGFAKSNIDITIDNGKLIIAGNNESDKTSNPDYLFKGIADRAFMRAFSISDTVEINNAELLNGMLKIWLENVIPENRKPRKVNINDGSAASTTKREKTLLTE